MRRASAVPASLVETFPSYWLEGRIPAKRLFKACFAGILACNGQGGGVKLAKTSRLVYENRIRYNETIRQTDEANGKGDSDEQNLEARYH